MWVTPEPLRAGALDLDDFIVIDVETATPAGREICSLALVHFQLGHVVNQKQMLIRPPCDIHPRLIDIHGLSDEHVAPCPCFVEAWPQLAAMLDAPKLVAAHNATFDLSVLGRELERNQIAPPDFAYVCTVRLARQVLPQLATYKLPILARHLGVSLTEHHDPLADARAAGEVLIRLAELDAAPPLVGDGVAADGQLRADLLAGKRFVFTGVHTFFKRPDIKRKIEAAGGTAVNSVTKKTDYVVVGYMDGTTIEPGKRSSKLIRAEALVTEGYPLEILTEQQFIERFFA